MPSSSCLSFGIRPRSPAPQRPGTRSPRFRPRCDARSPSVTPRRQRDISRVPLSGGLTPMEVICRDETSVGMGEFKEGRPHPTLFAFGMPQRSGSSVRVGSEGVLQMLRKLELSKGAATLDLHSGLSTGRILFTALARKGMPPLLRGLHQTTMIVDTLFLAVLTDLIRIKGCVQWPHSTSPQFSGKIQDNGTARRLCKGKNDISLQFLASLPITSAARRAPARWVRCSPDSGTFTQVHAHRRDPT